MEVESRVQVKKSNNFFSPLRYPGGKSSLSNYFTQLLKKNSSCTVYAEPYAGGAGAALELLFNEKVERIIINDYDKSIYSIWYHIIHDTNEFIKRIERARLTIDEWQDTKEVLNMNSPSFELGFAAFYLNRTNRSGIIKGGPVGGMDQKGKWKLDARFNKKGLIERVERIALYKNRIDVSNMDGISFMEKYKSEDNIFFYIDPPYLVKGGSLYYNHYREENHIELANFLSERLNSKWVLTYDNESFIRELYSKFRTTFFDLNYHAATPRVGNELMVYSNSLNL